MRPNGIERRKHDREGFFFAMFPIPQTRNRRFISRIDEQLKSAEAFEGHDFSGADFLSGSLQRFVTFGNDFAGRIPKLQLRTTLRTGIRLRVKTAVARVVIFALAIRAHFEFFHRRVRAIVRQRVDDGKTRTAIGAVCERITKAPIGWIENFAQTIRAGRNVRQNQRALFAMTLALANLEAFVAARVEKGGFEAVEDRARWLLFFKSG